MSGYAPHNIMHKFAREIDSIFQLISNLEAVVETLGLSRTQILFDAAFRELRNLSSVLQLSHRTMPMLAANSKSIIIIKTIRAKAISFTVITQK